MVVTYTVELHDNWIVDFSHIDQSSFHIQVEKVKCPTVKSMEIMVRYLSRESDPLIDIVDCRTKHYQRKWGDIYDYFKNKENSYTGIV